MNKEIKIIGLSDGSFIVSTGENLTIESYPTYQGLRFNPNRRGDYDPEYIVDYRIEF